MGSFARLWGSFGEVLGRLWEPLGSCGGASEASGEPLERFVEALGRLWRGFGEALGGFGEALGKLWGAVGEPLGGFVEALGAFQRLASPRAFSSSLIDKKKANSR